MTRNLPACLVVCIALVAVSGAVQANERHFTYTYETNVLAPGVIEVEPWATARIGKDRYYTGIDNRLEFEVGVAENLQTALYVNFGVEGIRAGNTIASTANHKGISSEWKYKLSDAVADSVGSAVYVEGTLAADEIELEGKLLLDKRMGNLHLACNAVYEFERNAAENIDEHKLHAMAGITYFVRENLSMGVEAMDSNVFEPASPGAASNLMHGAVFAGPVLGWSRGNAWLAVSLLPQLVGYGSAVPSGRGLNLDEFERFQGRILMGIHL